MDDLTEAFEDAYDLEPAHRALLDIATALMTEAEASDQQVKTDGRMIRGSTGQLIEHPGVRTAIIAREKAAKILRDLVPDGDGGNVDAHSLGQAESGAAHRARHASNARWSRARAVRDAG